MPGNELLSALSQLFPAKRLLLQPAQLAPYESDALTAFRARPIGVVLPETQDEVIETVRLCHEYDVPFVARGSGTSLSGGSLPLEEGIVIALNRLNRILKVDPVTRTALVEPGVVNLDVSKVAAPYGLYYAPDPSSQLICTIGGNVAFNSGGAHCLKYGMTANHVLGINFALAPYFQLNLLRLCDHRADHHGLWFRCNDFLFRSRVANNACDTVGDSQDADWQ